MSAKCRSCSAPILWAKTAAGKTTPLDAKPVRLAVVAEIVEEGVAVLRITGSVEGHQSHFATCPDADKHRKPKAATP